MFLKHHERCYNLGIMKMLAIVSLMFLTQSIAHSQNLLFQVDGITLFVDGNAKREGKMWSSEKDQRFLGQNYESNTRGKSSVGKYINDDVRHVRIFQRQSQGSESLYIERQLVGDKSWRLNRIDFQNEALTSCECDHACKAIKNCFTISTRVCEILEKNPADDYKPNMSITNPILWAHENSVEYIEELKNSDLPKDDRLKLKARLLDAPEKNGFSFNMDKNKRSQIQKHCATEDMAAIRRFNKIKKLADPQKEPTKPSTGKD